MTLLMILLDYKCSETSLMAPHGRGSKSADLSHIKPGSSRAHQLVKRSNAKIRGFTDGHPGVVAGLNRLAG